MENPLVSIAVITYNQQESLPKTLDSLLAQKVDFPYEIVVGEDCSTDNTREVLKGYVERYPDIIKPFYNETNKGVLGNYVATLAQCKGKYMAGCAGDDSWSDPEKLQLQVDIMEQHPEIGLVYTDVIVDSVATHQQFYRGCQDPQGNLFTQLLHGCFITAPTTCYRSELLQYVDFEEFQRFGFIMEDYPMWLTFSLHTKFYHLKRATVTYRIERGFINDPKVVSLHAVKFDENTTAIRLYFIKKYPDKTDLTENEILDAHNKIGYLAGLNMNDREFALKYVSQMHDRTPYVKRLTTICKSPLLFGIYQKYRALTGKKRSALEMYFGQ